MLSCPRCTYPLELHLYKDTEVDVCHRCHGTFVHPGGTGVAEEIEPDSWITLPSTEHLGKQPKLCCPLGHGPLNGYRVKGLGRAVEVDSCEVCGGLWLDQGEMDALQSIGAEALEVDLAEEQDDKKPVNVLIYLFQLFTGAPVEVWNPVRRTPYVLWALLFLMIPLYGYEYVLMSQGQEEIMGFLRVVGMVPAAVTQGENLLSLLTYAFFHGSLLHLFMNLYYFYIFGDNVEDVLGHGRFFLLFCLTAIAGGLLHALVDPSSSIPLVGASGAVAGIMGAYLVLFPRVKVWIVLFFVRFRLSVTWFLAFWLGMQVVRGMLQLNGQKSSVAWFAHIGGFVMGVLLVYAFGRQSLLDAAGFENPPEEERAAYE